MINPPSLEIVQTSKRSPIRLSSQVVKTVGETVDHEDTPMLEVQRGSIGGDDFWSLKPVLLPGDAAGMRVRRLLDRVIQSDRLLVA